MDVLLSLLWISGSGLWLGGEAKEQDHSRVGCFALNLVTVVSSLQFAKNIIATLVALIALLFVKN